MSIETDLKELILSRYKSLREFTIKIDMPYSTLDTILKRGVNKANISSIIKICKELNISTEALGEGIIEPKKEMDEPKNIDSIAPIAAHLKGKDISEEKLKRIEKFIEFTLNEED